MSVPEASQALGRWRLGSRQKAKPARRVPASGRLCKALGSKTRVHPRTHCRLSLPKTRRSDLACDKESGVKDDPNGAKLIANN
eukprot:scaffold150934_cov16-Prasinocladus_malaysianus.AAC.1